MVDRQFCTFFLNQIYFGIDVQYVQEIIYSQEVTRVPLAPSDTCGLINLRGQIVTVIDLQQRLETQCTIPQAFEASPKESRLQPDAPSFNIVVQDDDEVVSLLVDNIGDILELAEEDFEPPPATLQGRVREVLQGAFKLQDGFLLVLDTKKILNAKSYN